MMGRQTRARFTPSAPADACRVAKFEGRLIVPVRQRLAAWAC